MCGQDAAKNYNNNSNNTRNTRTHPTKSKQVSDDRPTLHFQPGIFLSEKKIDHHLCVKLRKFVVVQSHSFRIHATSLRRLRQNKERERENENVNRLTESGRRIFIHSLFMDVCVYMSISNFEFLVCIN